VISAFGLQVDLRLPVPDLAQAQAPPLAAVHRLTVGLAEHEDLERRWSGACTPRVQASAVVEGARWVVEEGRAGDRRMTHPLGRLHLDSAGTTLECAPADEHSCAWQRLLLDTGLVTASLARGFDALHASAVTFGGMAVAVAGPRGAGKTTLMAALLRRGALLLADDVVVLESQTDGGVLAHPGPPLANLPADMSAQGIGEVLHSFGVENWVRIDRSAGAACELGLVVMLELREDMGEHALRPVQQPAVALLAHALHTGSAPARRRARFELLAHVAARTRVMSLGRGPGLTVDRMADLVQKALAAPHGL
jgi:hypothetical protein